MLENSSCQALFFVEVEIVCVGGFVSFLLFFVCVLFCFFHFFKGRVFSSFTLATMIYKAGRRIICSLEGLYLMARSKHCNPPRVTPYYCNKRVPPLELSNTSWETSCRKDFQEYSRFGLLLLIFHWKQRTDEIL